MNTSSFQKWKPTYIYEDITFYEKEFLNLSFIGTRFSHVKFVRCTFKECDFSHAVFSRCDVYDCGFETCVLYFCQFEHCELTKTRFGSSYLSGIRLRSCDLTRTQFGYEFQIGRDRKIKTLPTDGPQNIYQSENAGRIPDIVELESNYDGIAIEGCDWYIEFSKDEDVKLINRKRCVVAAHVASCLVGFGRGDSAQYYYLARKNATLAQTRRIGRLIGSFEDFLWGYGYHPKRLLRAGLFFNLMAILGYLLCIVFGWGGLCDDGYPIDLQGLTSIGTCLYYSIVVGTTLGFGDVVPVGWCRFVLSVQVIANVVIIAMWLSYLTSPLRSWYIPEDKDININI